MADPSRSSPDLKQALEKLQGPSPGLVSSLNDLGSTHSNAGSEYQRPIPDPSLSETDIMNKKKAAIDKIELLSKTEAAKKGLDNPAFATSPDQGSSSGYDSNGGPSISETPGLRNSYLDAVGRRSSVMKDPSMKSGDVVMSFQPGRPSMVLPESDEDDNDSVCVIRDTDSLLEKTMASEEERIKEWDVFRQVPIESGQESTEIIFATFRQIFKLMTYGILFILVLGLTIMNKASLLLVTSQIRHSEDFPLECQKYSDFDNGVGRTFEECVALPYNHSNTFDTGCLEPPGNWSGNVTKVDKVYKGQMCDVMMLQWVWCLILIQCTPYVFVFLRNLWIVCFKRKKSPSADTIIFVLITDTLYVVGMCMFTFRVLPLLNNAIQGLMLMTGVAVIPAIFKVMTHRPEEPRRILKLVLDILALAGQISALVIWPVVSRVQYNTPGYWQEDDLVWTIPLSLFLISLSWWENYVDFHMKFGQLTKPLVAMSKRVRRARTKIQLISSIWKIGITIVLMMAFLSREVDDIRSLFNFDISTCEEGTLDYDQMPGLRLDWVWVWCVNFGSAAVCYFCARSAAKIQVQRISYALPLTLATPVLFAFMVGGCEVWNREPCSFATGSMIPGYLFIKCYPNGAFADAGLQQQWFMMAVWWLSQLWVSWHIWFPKSERLAKTDKIFVTPLFDSVLLEQSLLHNRARRDEPKTQPRTSIVSLSGMSYNEAEDDFKEESNMERLLRLRDQTPFIYICATMWHETEDEMVQVLKSLFKLDIDQSARRNAQEHLGVIDPDYYEFEAHIFFDDAMEAHGYEEYEYKVNSFVTLLVTSMNAAALAVHRVNLKLPPPIKYPCPYGGRLEWLLPGGNKIVAHLKDKVKIRHKKRWSQCMYMYYFLGHKLWAEDAMSIKRKQIRADNTYLLALDGDVDFEPLALNLLVDLMKRNDKVGAACGRIHPIGAGPMVWYQRFEYALGHWMQKSTEHVLGCVLCSPGCFSLFRGSALMDDNVMRKYCTMSTEAKHMVQFDQGEDRWLCTLLLQQGYRVEYSAASDSWTFAPEGFNEFFNQRRRWMPSTMANILDLLFSWRHTIKMNENISFLYIIYQATIFFASLLGPGTIFLMIVGALVVALNNAIDMWVSFFINLIPLLIFIILCYTTTTDTQLGFAAFMTAIYTVVQMLVLVGIIIQIAEQGPCSPTAVFFFYVAGVFVLCAILHPQEFFCLIHGFTYFLAIPSMYMLLMVYSMANMHVVSWGTREVKQTKTEKQEEVDKKFLEEQKKAQAAAKKKNNAASLLGMLKASQGETKDEGWTLSCGNCMRCMCCPREVPVADDAKLKAILTKLDDMESSVDNLHGTVDRLRRGKTDVDETHFESEDGRGSNWRLIPQSPKVAFADNPIYEEEEEIEDLNEESDEEEVEVAIKRDDMINPAWMEDPGVGEGPIGRIPEKELVFFNDLIKQYLLPLEKDAKQQERITMELLDLRNKMSFAFLMINAVFVVVIFTLQMNVERLSIPWPCGDNLSIEPLGFFFLVFFGIIMFLQTVGMLTHRMTTFLHICATTVVRFWKREDDFDVNNVEDAIELARNLGALKDDDSYSVSSFGSAVTTGESDEADDSKTLKKRRKTLYKINRATKREKEGTTPQNVGDAFNQRLEKLNHQLEYEDITPEEIEKKVLGKRGGSSNMKRRQSVSAIKYLQEQRSRAYSTASGRNRTQSQLSQQSNHNPQPSIKVPDSSRAMSIVSEETESAYEEIAAITKLNKYDGNTPNGAEKPGIPEKPIRPAMASIMKTAKPTNAYVPSPKPPLAEKPSLSLSDATPTSPTDESKPKKPQKPKSPPPPSPTKPSAPPKPPPPTKPTSPTSITEKMAFVLGKPPAPKVPDRSGKPQVPDRSSKPVDPTDIKLNDSTTENSSL